MANVKLGQTVIPNVSSVQLENADNPAEPVVFAAGGGGGSFRPLCIYEKAGVTLSDQVMEAIRDQYFPITIFKFRPNDSTFSANGNLVLPTSFTFASGTAFDKIEGVQFDTPYAYPYSQFPLNFKNSDDREAFKKYFGMV